VGEGTNSGVFGPVSGAKISSVPRYRYLCRKRERKF
jgi:hypothetical protein